MQLPRLELEHRRLEQGDRLPVGLSACGSQEAVATRGAGGAARRLRVHQHGPRRPGAGRLSRAASSRRISTPGGSRIDTSICTSPNGSPCNWKLAIEAFLEAYHVIRTHPQVAVSNGDANSQYDVYGEHVDRFISTAGRAEPASVRQTHRAGHSQPVHAGRQRRARRCEAHLERRHHGASSHGGHVPRHVREGDQHRSERQFPIRSCSIASPTRFSRTASSSRGSRCRWSIASAPIRAITASVFTR